MNQLQTNPQKYSQMNSGGKKSQGNQMSVTLKAQSMKEKH